MKYILFIVISLSLFSCANIVAPSGGPKDITPPSIISVDQNIAHKENIISEFIYSFDERIQLHDFSQNFYISPPLEKVSNKIKGKDLIITIEDKISDTLVYSICMDNCIKDITEGNILKNFRDDFTSSNMQDGSMDIYSLQVNLEHAFTRKRQKNHWVLLYNYNIEDSLIFKALPNFVSKTNELGVAYFENLIGGKYKAFSLSGMDFKYHDDEIVSFFDDFVIAGRDSTVNLLSFNSLQKIDSTVLNNDTLIQGGSLTLTTNLQDSYVLQLLKGDRVYMEKAIQDISSIKLINIPTGEYNLRLYIDKNKNGYWDTGDFAQKKQAEHSFIYPEIITIRSNWDLELEWQINQ